MRATFSCCFNCVPPKRHAGCHATCNEYISAKATHAKQKKERQKSYQADAFMSEHYNRTTKGN